MRHLIALKVVTTLAVFSLSMSAIILPSHAQEPAAFKTEFAIAPTSIGKNQSNPSVLVSSSGTVYVAWDEEIDGGSEIFVARSTNKGESFESPIRLTDSDGQGNHTNPVLGSDSTGTILVACENLTGGDSDISVIKSQGPWGSFTTPVEASDGPAGSDQINPDLVVDSLGTVHVAWEDLRTDRDIRASRAPISTLAFGASVKVNDDTGNAWQHEPSIAVDENNSLYIAWYDRRNIDPFIYISKSADGGVTYDANVQVNGTTSGPQFEPAITARGGRVYAAWQDGRSGISRDIYFSSAHAGTLAFGDSVKVNSGTTASNQRSPSLDVGGDGAIHVVWQDFRDGVHDIYYALSADEGMNFQNRKVNQAPGDSILEKAKPKVDVSMEGIIYVVWEDQRPGDAKTVIAISGLGGDGNGNGHISTDLLTWVVIAVVVLVVSVAAIAVLLHRRAGKK